VQVSVARTPGGGGGGGGVSGNPVSTGPIGLAIEEFELTMDTVLALIEGMLFPGTPTLSALNATIAHLQNAVANDPLTPTSQGQLSISFGQSAAVEVLIQALSTH
jgi:hypothetical protein